MSIKKATKSRINGRRILFMRRNFVFEEGGFLEKSNYRVSDDVAYDTAGTYSDESRDHKAVI